MQSTIEEFRKLAEEGQKQLDKMEEAGAFQLSGEAQQAVAGAEQAAIEEKK